MDFFMCCRSRILVPIMWLFVRKPREWFAVSLCLLVISPIVLLPATVGAICSDAPPTTPTTTTCGDDDSSFDKQRQCIQAVLDWIRTHPRGFVSPKLELQPQSSSVGPATNDKDKKNDKSWVWTVTEPVEPEEVLWSIPWDQCLVVMQPQSQPSSWNGTTVSVCALIQALHNPQEGGEGPSDSADTNKNLADQENEPVWTRTPLVDYLSSQVLLGVQSPQNNNNAAQSTKPPRLWSSAGRQALQTLLGEDFMNDHPDKDSSSFVSLVHPWTVQDSHATDTDEDTTSQQGMVDSQDDCVGHDPQLVWALHQWIALHGRPFLQTEQPPGAVLIPLYDLLTWWYQEQTPKASSSKFPNLKIVTPLDNHQSDPDEMDHNPFQDEESVTIQASRFIAAGQPLAVATPKASTWPPSHSNVALVPEMGTMFQTYGIVRTEFPQYWILPVGTANDTETLVLTVDRATDTEREVHDEHRELQLLWYPGATPLVNPDSLLHDEHKRTQWLEFVQHHIQRLYLHSANEKKDQSLIPQAEWDAMVAYREALLTVLEALEDVLDGAGYRENGSTSADDKEPLLFFATTRQGRYNLLDVPYNDYRRETCDEQAPIDSIQKHSKVIDRLTSPYQTIVYDQDPEKGNICYGLDGIYQQCTSYRPQYHEMMVHYPARFLPFVKRVLWVGGGDAMLLHEILKYSKSLELAVGLELDQQVTRKAFQHYGVQPHFDDHRVQWWYGDAAKSLSMMPSEYFGTFDLVLVDLSETVLSFPVSDGLDIWTALSLLLQPNGIFVKNGFYFQKLNKIFPHSAQIINYDIPLIYRQSFALGSFETDFLHTHMAHHHGVKTLFAPLENVDSDLTMMHDYHWNSTAKPYNDKTSEMSESTSGKPRLQDKSPGLLLVVEAEQILDTSIIASAEALQNTIVRAIEMSGLLTIVSSMTLTDGDQVVIIVLAEGYIVARGWPANEYCALDIHLWSAFDRMEAVKDELLVALQSPYFSLYRMVAGGMFGVQTWQRDASLRGPQFRNSSDDSPASHNDSENKMRSAFSNGNAQMYQHLLHIYYEEVLRTWLPVDKQKNRNIALAICGSSEERCHSPEVFRTIFHNNAFDGTIIPIWTCPNLLNGGNDTSVSKFLCEREVNATLHDLVGTSGQSSESQGISLIALDATAPFAMAQIVHKVLRSSRQRSVLLSDRNLLVLSSSNNGADDSTSTWRRMFVDQFRSILPHQPAFVSHVTFSNDTNIFDTLSFVSGDSSFTMHSKEATKNFELRANMVSNTHHIGGVELKYQRDFTPSQFFTSRDYDQRGPFHQWKMQRPVGFQILVQIEVDEFFKSESDLKSLLDLAIKSSDDEVEYTLELHDFTNLGEGSVIVGAFSGGKSGGLPIVCLWDGRNHIDVNIFRYHENRDFADKFTESLTSSFQGSLHVVLRDEMPRGHGRVVNFKSDLDDKRNGKTPYWASHLS